MQSDSFEHGSAAIEHTARNPTGWSARFRAPRKGCKASADAKYTIRATCAGYVACY
jgi:hypothetical protein